ncbi:VIT domain-containing protein [Oceaniferula spumae]
MKLLHLLLPLSFLLLAGCHHSSSDRSLTIENQAKGRQHIRITDVEANVVITGRMAETTMLLKFENSSDRVLEAMLDLPLPEGASISRYALEVNGKLREGVIVDKQLGRVAFENTIRQGIDPGLLEKTQGNRFRTRIYPVPAKGSKRVLVSYIEPLKSYNGSTNQMRYNLPLSLSKKLNNFKLRMTSQQQGSVITPIGKVSGVVKPSKELSIDRRNTRVRDLSFLISTNAEDADVIIQRGNDGSRYFHLTHQLPTTSLHPRSKPERILLVWDASHSMGSRDLKRELALLDQYFEYNSNTQVDLRILRDQLLNGGRFSVTEGNWQSLHTTLKNLHADGATRMDRLKIPSSTYGAVFYFGDGLSTIGDAPSRWGNSPVFTVNSSASADHILLSQMAKTTGGANLNLSHLTDQQAARRLTHENLSLIKVSGAGVAETITDSGDAHATVSGRMTQSKATLKLHYGVNRKVLTVKTVRLDTASHSSRGNIAAKLWAQGRVNELASAKRKNRAKIVKLAQTHHLVTEFTSLIVLDRIEDYVRYRIVPPEASMRKQYYESLKDTEAYDGSEPADMQSIYEEWKDQVKWHQEKFPRPARKRPSSVGDGTTDNLPPAPAPVMSMPMGGGRVSNVATAGLRSGDFAITRNSIDAILNNPSRTPKSSISIKGWQPDTPYLKALQKAVISKKPLLPVYYQWKEKHGRSAGFYLDVADFFIAQKRPTIAKRILSNLAELSPESPEMLRILAHRYSQLAEYELAEMLFKEVAEIREEEPQSRRDLALLLVKRKRYQEAADLLWQVVSRKWNGRFDGVQMIALNEWNQLVSEHRSKVRVRASQQRFRHLMDCDIRVIISWDTDNSDMDLWVTDPKGEKCYYSNTLTRLGGRISDDMTDGRGPEEFLIRRAPSGKYKIQANYYGSRQQTLIGPTTLHATVITNWGRSNQKEKHLTFRLGQKSEVVEIGEVDFER